MDKLIELTGSLILFLNKILLQKKIKSGWILGIIGIIIISIPVYQKALFINLAYHLGLITLMIYGYAIARRTPFLMELDPSTKIQIKSILILLTLCLCLYLFINTKDGGLNNWQLIQSISGLAGSMFLAFHTRISLITGWISNIISHITCIYCMHCKELYWIEFFQVLSIPVAIYAITQEFTKKSHAIK